MQLQSIWKTNLIKNNSPAQTYDIYFLESSLLPYLEEIRQWWHLILQNTYFVSYVFHTFFFFFCFPLFNNKVWIFRAIHAPPSLWALSFTYEKQVQNITYQVVWHQREILDSRQVQDDHKAVLCTWFGKLQSSELWCILEQIVLCSFRCRTVQSFTSILAVKYKFFVY